MFSIAAINDGDSRGQWEPLAPTKEAQEFHLSQIYQDGLMKLQAKEYDKARELLETVLKDPLISAAHVNTGASDGHMLQLRFLALKNLANVFLKKSPSHYESALDCYLQAAEIDTKDSVVWNQLGTLSCSMGLLSISRWAFEQGLLCSPNNWNCMEKLLEVLISIGDEVSCLSVAELILRHWPSHSRALHVKNIIEELDPVPFAPRGIDKLKPKHAHLNFLKKRKTRDDDCDGSVEVKKVKNIELQLVEASWVALTDALTELLLPSSACRPGMGDEKANRSKDVPITIQLPSTSDNVMEDMERQGLALTHCGDIMSLDDCNTERASGAKEKEALSVEDQPQERRSGRLERMRSRQPGKEDLDFSNSKDPAKCHFNYLETFIMDRSGSKKSEQASIFFASCNSQAQSLPSDYSDVAKFVRETSKNFGACHMAHLLLEYVASNNLPYQDGSAKLLKLEKLTRHWGQDRTPECSLFLAELYYDLGCSSNSNWPTFTSEASYHLCKIIELLSLDYPFHWSPISGQIGCHSVTSFHATDKITVDDSISKKSILDSSLSSRKGSFWVRYFWLSGQLSILEGNKRKAFEQYCITLSLVKKENLNDSYCTVHLPHCQTIKELTFDRVLYEISMLKVDFLLEKDLNKMIEREMYTECVNLLAPLLFSTTNVLPLPATDRRGETMTTLELSALNILIKACEKASPFNIEVHLKCHRRKLQILTVLGGIDESLASCEVSHQIPGSKMLSPSDTAPRENSTNHELVVEEVKAILQCVLQVKTYIDQSGDYNDIVVPLSIVGDIQCLLLQVMFNVARNFPCTKSCDTVISDQNEQRPISCFLDAAIAFCKLQHLSFSVPVKSQVNLIAGFHDLLAEYGLCCAGESGTGEEGTFLKFAIKHLLALDMKFKAHVKFLNKEAIVSDNPSESKLISDMEIGGLEKDQTIVYKADIFEKITTEGSVSYSGLEKDEAGKSSTSDGTIEKGEKCSSHITECTNKVTEDEREELELIIDNALDQCFLCLYGLNLRCDTSYEDDLAVHKNTSRGDYQTKEQCADVFQYIFPYAKASSKTGLVKLRRVLRAIRKHFPQPPDDVLAGNAIDKYLDDPGLCEDKLSEESGYDGFIETITKIIFSGVGGLKQYKSSLLQRSQPYLDIYSNLYHFLAQAEEISATDKWPGFVLTKEGEEFVQQNTKLFKYDLLYNPRRFESWQRLATMYDEEVDLLLNDGSKHINVAGWRKNATLAQRVETSRRRSRRCLLMSLALAKTSDQQCEIHELLALVYYDSLQNVVPIYDMRYVTPSKDAAWIMFCENSLKHFKKAFSHKQDWSHAFYMGKLCEKLGYSHELSLSYYDKAISLNTSAVDPVYRMHASRLKLLCKCGKQNLEAIKVISVHCFDQAIKDAVMNIFDKVQSKTYCLLEDGQEENSQAKMEEMWHMLYNDCLSALETCVEGDLKHFHKARFMLAQALYRRGENNDLERAKDELSFCFKSARSSFTINMWEIDGMVKKGRRKTPGVASNRKVLEVNLPESSRKFITCIRKYLLFYLKLLEETGDISTLERAYISLRSDKRFSMCVDDIVPVALGRYIKTLILSMNKAETKTTSNPENQLEKIFYLFMDHGNLWPEICSLQDIKSPETSESILYGCLHQYISSLERKGKLESLETINERFRKRFKNPKLSNSNCAKVCRHASFAWCRSLIVSLASITPLQFGQTVEIQTLNSTDVGFENSQLVCIDIQANELWSSSLEDMTHLESHETIFSPTLTKIKNIIIKKVSDTNMEAANSLLRGCYNFYRETSCVVLTSGVNLYLVPSRLAKETELHSSMEGVEVLDLSTPRKLLLWAYTLLHGRGANISVVVKYCEDNAKVKMKRGSAIYSPSPNASTPPSITTQTGGPRDSPNVGGSTEASPAPAPVAAPVTTVPFALPSDVETISNTNQPPPSGENQKP